MHKNRSRLPNAWVFLPGMLIAAIIFLFYHYNVRPGEVRNWYALAALALVVPALAGLVSWICGWGVTRLLAALVVGLYWALVGGLITFSAQGFYVLLLFGWMIVPLFMA